MSRYSIHPTYYGSSTEPVPYSGSRLGLKGGEYLGTSARPDLLNAVGDVIAATEAGTAQDWMEGYWYDPLFKIEGQHYIRALVGKSMYWLKVEFAMARTAAW